jgi:hypothetical protein
MPYITRPIEDFQDLIQPLIGMVVSLPWKGYGATIFLELGKLAPLESERQHYKKGESCISGMSGWRVESGSEVLFGTLNSNQEIERGILSLLGTKIERLSIVGRVPELEIQFSNGYCLRSMVMVSGQPEWAIRLPSGDWLDTIGSLLSVGDGRDTRDSATEEEEDTFESEQAMYALAQYTAKRWGTPILEPKLGECAHCASFVPVDGHGALLDYGVCIEKDSSFDGHIVMRKSGCPSFILRTPVEA